jgi:hypothetical protein
VNIQVEVQARLARSNPFIQPMREYRELLVEEMLGDPIVRALMAADGVDQVELKELLRSVSGTLRNGRFRQQPEARGHAFLPGACVG